MSGFARDAGRPPDEPLVTITGGAGTPIPQAPYGKLSDRGKQRWHRLWRTGRAWLSNDAHYELMVMLVEVAERRDKLQAAAAKLKRYTVTTQTGEKLHPVLTELRQTETHLVSLLTAAKFTPDPKMAKVAPRQRSRLEELDAQRGG
jgi:hypothetical protein